MNREIYENGNIARVCVCVLWNSFDSLCYRKALLAYCPYGWLLAIQTVWWMCAAHIWLACRFNCKLIFLFYFNSFDSEKLPTHLRILVVGFFSDPFRCPIEIHTHCVALCFFSGAISLNCVGTYTTRTHQIPRWLNSIFLYYFPFCVLLFHSWHCSILKIGVSFNIISFVMATTTVRINRNKFIYWRPSFGVCVLLVSFSSLRMRAKRSDFFGATDYHSLLFEWQKFIESQVQQMASERYLYTS